MKARILFATLLLLAVSGTVWATYSGQVTNVYTPFKGGTITNDLTLSGTDVDLTIAGSGSQLIIPSDALSICGSGDDDTCLNIRSAPKEYQFNIDGIERAAITTVGVQSTDFRLTSGGIDDTNGDLILEETTSIAGVFYSTTSTLTLGAGAATFAVTRNIHVIDCDAGGNTISTITGAPSGGSVLLTLKFVDANCTLDDTDDGGANTIDLIGAATDITSADDMVVELVYDSTSTNWHQVSEEAAN